MRPVVLAIVSLLAASAAQAIKTPPLSSGDGYVLPIDIHVGTPPTVLAGDPLGWAGGIVIPHVLDATELDVVTITPAPGLMGNALGPPNSVFGAGPLASPFGPASSNVQSAPLSLNLVATPTATNSGMPVSASSSLFLGSIDIRAKGSSPAGNSDVDLTLALWNIWHAGTATIELAASDRIWMTGAQTAVTTMFISPVSGGLFNTTAHWVHNSVTQILNIAPSVFLATFAGTVPLGIEHIPEPATGALLGLGVASLALHRSARRRRLRA